MPSGARVSVGAACPQPGARVSLGSSSLLTRVLINECAGLWVQFWPLASGLCPGTSSYFTSIQEALGVPRQPPSLCCAQNTVSRQRAQAVRGLTVFLRRSGIRPPLLMHGALQTVVFMYIVWCSLFSRTFQAGGYSSPLLLHPGDRGRLGGVTHSHVFLSPVLLRPLEPVPLMLSHPPVLSTVSASSHMVF